MTTVEAFLRFEGISPKAYEHPADRAATSALRSIPMIDVVLKRLIDLGHVGRLRQVMIGNAVRIGDNQLPAIWTSHQRAATVLDVSAVPELYVTQTPLANALTVGAQRPYVVVFSGLVSSYEVAEVDTVLAHEMAHVLSEHYYYQTALVLLSRFVSGVLPRSLVGLPIQALYLILLEWSRAAELSCDRAAALVMGDPLVPCGMLMRMAGGAIEGMSLDAFVAQAASYAEEDDLFVRWGRAWVEVGLSHPFAVKRVRELVAWVQEGDYDRIRSGGYVRRGQEPPPSAEFESAVSHYRQRFTQVLERTAGGVQRLAAQMEDWLRRRTSSEDDGD